MNWTKGADWRKWDLHVHSPASQNFAGDWNQFIIQLGNADCDVIGINDYFSVAGYKEIQRRLNDPGAAAEGNKPYREALEKLKSRTLLPVVECRMNNVVLDKKLKSGPRINFHLIFSPKVSPDDIETFVKSLKVKGTSIGSRYNDSKFLLDEVSVNFGEICQQLRGDGTFADRFLIWIPYDEYGGIGPINPATDTLFKEGLVSEADILGSSNKEQGDFFLWKDGKFTEDQYRKWFGRRKPCIKGSDSHNVNDELGKLKDHQSKPTDKYCWIKADQTFNGLRQIINEPEDRVYIGRIPPKMKEVRLYPTRYLSHVSIRKAADAETDEIWFNCEIPLNFDMVAIIGNKGTGKSALADVLALAGNTHCDPKYFSFLTKDRFCERNGRIAKQFEIETVWAEDTKTVTSLNSKPDLNNVELVKYIPQTYLEKVCTETEPGQQSEFQRELRKVIFSHISDADRLGKESLDELIEYKTEELTTQRNSQQQEISRLNSEVVRLEAKGTVDYAAQLDGKLKLKRKELEAHEANKPTPVEKPNNLNAEQQAVYANIGGKLENERTMLVSLETQITEHQARQKTLIEHLALAKKLEGKFDNFESEFVRLKQECAADCKKLSLEVGTILTLTIDRAALTQKHDALVAEKVKIDAALSLTEDSSLLSQKTAFEGRIKALQDKLDAPNKQYQTYQEALKSWQQQKEIIEGDAEKVDTLRYYEAQLKYVKELLPQEIAAVKGERLTAARKVHESIAAIKDVYRELFASVQELIEGSIIIKEGFKLTFYSSITERTLQQDLFEKYINQGVAGSFCGKDKGAAMLEELRAEYDFNKADDTIAFVEKVMVYLEHDMRTSQQGEMNIGSQLRKHVETKQLYDYLWSLPYLAPEYSLKLDGKDLSHLSPGERGTLLLVFYLLVDKSNSPIIVDQPEENLDSETVYRLLIPVIKEVKKRRQIIMVTHSPNIAVVCDAEQIIHAFIDRENGNRVIYTMGAIESPEINKFLVDVLEGTRPAFDNRESKYYA
ncbi:MAG: AAA family ATPase [Nitrospirales bacterium]|nr:AAA family ATPase [Nitrospirales bacterium]